jgi:4-hydroxybenzoate polyprenyltransferase
MDCITTAARIKNIEHEKNSFARRLMNKFGIKTTIFGIFVITLLIVGICLIFIYLYHDEIICKLTYIVLGLLIAIVQFAVANTNKTGKINFITRFILKSNFYE